MTWEPGNAAISDTRGGQKMTDRDRPVLSAPPVVDAVTICHHAGNSCAVGSRDHAFC